MEFHHTRLQLSRQELEDLNANMNQAEIALWSEIVFKRCPRCTSVHCAPVPTVTVSGKNSQESHCAQSCMLAELEAQSWRTDIHQFKYLTLPNPFITHFGDGEWFQNSYRRISRICSAPGEDQLCGLFIHLQIRHLRGTPVADLDLQREMRPRRGFVEAFHLNTKLFMPAKN